MAVTSSRQFDLSVMEEQYDEIRNPALGHGMGGIWLESQHSQKILMRLAASLVGEWIDNFFRMSDIKVLECNVMITHPRKTYCFRATQG